MSFLERLLGRRYESSSGEVAKDEIITVISRHVDIDAEGVEVTFSQSARETRLVADIPLLTRRRRSRR
jgi:septum formation topological specificity factor MinE